MSTTLVLGAARSGASRHAESLLADHDQVTSVAARRPDPSGTEATRRREDWEHVETLELSRALMSARSPVLIDCLDSWVHDVLNEAQAWDAGAQGPSMVHRLVDELLVAMMHLPYDIVVVSRESGWGVAPADPRQALLRDLVGEVNRRVSAASQRVHLVVAGRVLDLSDAALVRDATYR